MALAEVVVTSTRRDLVVTLKDENANVINITGGAVRLQGRSRDVPAKTIDTAGTLTDAANGIVTFTNIGALVTASDLSTAPGAPRAGTFTLRVKYTDATAKIDFTPTFDIIWSADPTVAF